MKIGRVVYIAVIGFVFLYLIYAMARFGDQNAGRRVDSVQRIVEKALVQCYALEGSYPFELEQVEHYGVILDYNKYIFHYEWIAPNVKPIITVFEGWG
ncbi:MAG: hypothetical protein FWF03_02295 [Defluviitaleaceae bacterium]|nr:hypothetical protein [Defluviitaleaceae bacterium]